MLIALGAAFTLLAILALCMLVVILKQSARLLWAGHLIQGSITLHDEVGAGPPWAIEHKEECVRWVEGGDYD